MIDSALAYAGLGWRLLPIWSAGPAGCACPRGPACESPGKHPVADLAPRGLLDATSDPATLRVWFAIAPSANLAVDLAGSGLAALDVDGAGWEGRLAALEAAHGPLPPSVVQRSGSGAAHYLFRAPLFPLRGKLATALGDVTVRGRNYVVVAPSQHRSGGRYEWVCSPWEAPVAELPERWLVAVRRPELEGVSGIPEVEPDWLAAVPAERRVADARDHLSREQGEVKGASPQGLSYNVTRTAVRAYAIRDPRAALDLLAEYDARCSPPYGRPRVAERVAKVYRDAQEPEWGSFYKPNEVLAALGPGVAGPTYSALGPSVAGPGPVPTHYRGASLVARVRERARVPWIPLHVGTRRIVEIRAGGIALLIGGSGRGKSSLAISILLEHARLQGPAIAMSLELPADEFGARAIGIEEDKGWGDVLRGHFNGVSLPERFAVIERSEASLAAVAALVESMRAEYPGQPILVGVDYVQLVDSSEREIRRQVADAMRRIDAAARGHEFGTLVLSQGSRASAKALSTGEKLGAETADAGAEAAELERWSTVTLALGEARDVDDRTREVDLSIGKSRMGAGDTVLSLKFHGASGRWAVEGDPRPAREVREERQQARQRDDRADVAAKIVSKVRLLAHPASRNEIVKQVGAGRKLCLEILDELLADPSSGVVECNTMRKGFAEILSREKAEKLGLLKGDPPPSRERA